jgi:hypothetical protein
LQRRKKEVPTEFTSELPPITAPQLQQRKKRERKGKKRQKKSLAKVVGDRQQGSKSK